MTHDEFATAMAKELSERNADIPFETLLHLVKKTHPADGSKISPSETVELFFQHRLVSSLSAEEWEAATDPATMLIRVRFLKLDRELTEFACTCCRRAWHLLPADFQGLLETLEQFLRDNSRRGMPETLFLVDSPRRLEWEDLFCVNVSQLDEIEESVRVAAHAVYDLFEPGYAAAVGSSLGSAEAIGGDTEGSAYVAERAKQADLLRATIGNPLKRDNPHDKPSNQMQ